MANPHPVSTTSLASSFSVNRIRQCSLLPCKCWCCVLPQRVVFVLLLHWSLESAYNLRIVLNVAITVMVSPKVKNITEFACASLHKDVVHEKLGEQHAWPRDVEMMILYAFFIGYLLSHVPGGILADKLGGRWVLFGSIIISTIITAIIPLSTEIAGYWLIIVLRGLLGLVQGPILPCIASMVSHWVPKQERAVLGGLAYAGSNLGTVIGSILTGIVIKAFGSWHAAFYFWSAWCCVYMLFHYVWLYSYPETHPHITSEELNYIQKNVVRKMKLTVPWKKILTNRPFWANVSGQFGHNYIFFTLSTSLPLYMKDILAYDVQRNGVMSALPFFVLWVFSLVYSVSAKYIQALVGRKYFDMFFGPLSNIGASVCVLGAMYVGCDRMWVMTLYVLAMMIKPFYYCTMAVNINDLSKNFSGTLFAICNGISTLGGIFGNWLVGYLTSDGKLSQWQMVFWVCLGITTVTSLIFMFFLSPHRQAFDILPEEDEEFERLPPQPKR